VTDRTILPRAASDSERALDSAAAKRILALDSRLVARLWDPERAAEELLPALAWALSIDEWRPEWDAGQKRRAILAAAEVHRIKGTDRAVLDALRTIGISARIEHWHGHKDDPSWPFRTDDVPPTARPYTFRIIVVDVDLDARLDQIKRVVDGTKRASAHYEALTLADPAMGQAWALAAGHAELVFRAQHDVDISSEPVRECARVLIETGDLLLTEAGAGLRIEGHA